MDGKGPRVLTQSQTRIGVTREHCRLPNPMTSITWFIFILSIDITRCIALQITSHTPSYVWLLFDGVAEHQSIKPCRSSSLNLSPGVVPREDDFSSFSFSIPFKVVASVSILSFSILSLHSVTIAMLISSLTLVVRMNRHRIFAPLEWLCQQCVDFQRN